MKIIKLQFVVMLMFGLFNCKNQKTNTIELKATVLETNDQDVTFIVDEQIEVDHKDDLTAYEFIISEKASEYSFKVGEVYTLTLSDQKTENGLVRFPELNSEWWLEGPLTKVKDVPVGNSHVALTSAYKQWRKQVLNEGKVSHQVKAIIVEALTVSLTGKDSTEENRCFRLICKTSEVIKGDTFPEYFTVYFELEKEHQPATSVPELKTGTYLFTFAPSSKDGSGMLRTIPTYDSQLISEQIKKEQEMIKMGQMPEPNYEANGLRLVGIYLE